MSLVRFRTPVRAPKREEETIAHDPIDRALRTHLSRSRLVSAGILLLGLLAVAAILLSADRRRERAASRLAVGDDSTAVARTMGGSPVRCPTGTLAHLYESFPGGTPRPTREAALERLRLGTAARWIYPDDGEGAGCTARSGDTEVGLGRDGRVLWVVPVTGREFVEAPDTIF